MTRRLALTPPHYRLWRRLTDESFGDVVLGFVNGGNEGALPPGSIGSVGSVSDRISAKAGKQIARDVTNLPKCEGRNGLMGPLAHQASCLDGGALRMSTDLDTVRSL